MRQMRRRDTLPHGREVDGMRERMKQTVDDRRGDCLGRSETTTESAHFLSEREAEDKYFHRASQHINQNESKS
jgi:hypothetical protein